MKNLLSVFLCVAFAVSAFAQDIIVKKDGSAIKAKVEKVTSTEVEYKKASHPDGPTYAVSTADLISIDYQNGTRDVFTSSAINEFPAGEAISRNYVTEETASMYSNDMKLLELYNKKSPVEIEINKGKKIRTISLCVGGAIFLGGAFASFIGDPGGWNTITGGFEARDLGYCLMGIGLIGGTTGYIIGNHKIKTAQNKISAFTIYSKDILAAESHILNIGIDMINSNNQDITIGLGLKYNF